MIFTKPRARIINTSNESIPVEKPLLLFTSSRRYIPKVPIHVPSNVSVVHAKSYEDQVAMLKDVKKVKWGEPFWNFLHVLAEKVKSHEFDHVRKGLLNLIYVICSNLPCPDCTQHAISYLNGVNFNLILSKENLRDMLYNFHNAVNVRKGYPLYPKDQVESKYSRGNLEPIFQEFMKHFLTKSYSFRLIADEIHRKRISNNINEWMKNNRYAFI
jgi:hypothetical protein|tara:strand:+ start:1665 stop:2306 length:642 start_codon:yes stop_codon:yes gene_type:complete